MHLDSQVSPILLPLNFRSVSHYCRWIENQLHVVTPKSPVSFSLLPIQMSDPHIGSARCQVSFTLLPLDVRSASYCCCQMLGQLHIPAARYQLNFTLLLLADGQLCVCVGGCADIHKAVFLLAVRQAYKSIIKVLMAAVMCSNCSFI